MDVVMSRAGVEEVELVMQIVNTAYKVELGSEGVAFKCGDRWPKFYVCHELQAPSVSALLQVCEPV
jgi:hypothetical protein